MGQRGQLKIEPTQNPVLFAVRYQADVFTSGTLAVGQALATSLELIFSEDDNAFLAAMVGKAGNYQPLPGAGTSLEAGTIYGYNGGLVIVRQSHVRTGFTPDTTPALFSVYRAGATGSLDWIAKEPVVVGTKRKYAGTLYEAIQAHVTEFNPSLTPALWRVWVDASSPQPWVQPTGAQDAYPVGAKVTYGGFAWQNTTPSNVWVPGIYGWVKI